MKLVSLLFIMSLLITLISTQEPVSSVALPRVALPADVLAQTPDPVLVGAGDIAVCNRDEDELTAQLLDDIDGTIFTLGDDAYPDGTLSQFTNCFGPTWGRHKDRIRPSVGNHEYHTTGAAGYFTYFGEAASPLDQNCNKGCKGYYSYDLDEWHIIVLNSEIDHNPGSAQVQWLQEDLAANQRMCTLAYWHKPRFSSGAHGSNPGVGPFWQVLYDYQVDVVLNGHDHLYERFAPQNPSGVADPTQGIRQFVVGTGGARLYSFDIIEPNSEARASTWGVLKLTLHPSSYDWEFIPVAGQTFTDSGSADCASDGTIPTATPTPTATPSPLPTPSASPTPTVTPTSIATSGASPTPTATPTSTATSSASPTPTATTSPSATLSASLTPTNTPVPDLPFKMYLPTVAW